MDGDRCFPLSRCVAHRMVAIPAKGGDNKWGGEPHNVIRGDKLFTSLCISVLRHCAHILSISLQVMDSSGAT